jgi:MFS family permease
MEKDEMMNSSSSDTDQAEEIQPGPHHASTGAGAEPSLPAEKTLEETTSQPAEPAAATHANPPDGGLQAWLQVLGGTCTLVATWGLVNSFGVFQTFYETTLLVGRNTSSDISWIGSLQGALLMMIGVISGPLYDAGYFRHLLAVGLLLIVLGMFMTSLATAYWQLLLAQGVCVGIGMGMVFLPSTAILAQYFSKKLPLVIGLASAGSPVAGIIFPIIFSRLEPRIGFGWATRVIAFIVLGLSAVPVAFMKVRVVPGSKRAIWDKTALTDSAFLVFAAGCFVAFLALYVPFFYTQLYTIAHGITDADFAPYLVTFLNVGSVFGRVIPNALAGKYGSLNMMIVCAGGSAILAFGWFGTKNLGGLTVFALLYGAFSGGVVSLSPSCLKNLTPDMTRLGARMGMCFSVTGVALLVGTPIAGAILGNGNWTPTIGYTAALMMGSVLLYGVSRWLVWRRER